MARTRKKRGGVRSLRKFSKKVKKKVKTIPSEIEEVATEIPKKVMKKVKSEGARGWAKVKDVVKGPLEKLEAPVRGLLKDTEEIVSDMIPPVPNTPFDVDVTQTAKNALTAMTEIPEKLMEAPEIILKSGKNMVRKVERLSGLNKMKKIPRRIYGSAKRGFTKVNRKTRKLLKKLPVGRVVKKVKEVPGDVKELVEKMSHPTLLAKDVGHGIKKMGHRMVNGVKHVATGLLPTFVWPVDGRCPPPPTLLLGVIKGGRRPRRRRRKTRRYRKRRRKRRTRKKRRRRRRRTRRR